MIQPKILDRFVNRRLILLYGLAFSLQFIFVTSQDVSVVQITLLNLHNEARNRHNAKPLLTNNSVKRRRIILVIIAQNWANQMAKTRKLKHSGMKGVGENIWMAYGTHPNIRPDYRQACKYWMDESRYWNFETDASYDPNKVTGHFTQMVWKSTTSLGCAKADSSDKLSTYICCNYYPPGNIRYKYKSNVS